MKYQPDKDRDYGDYGPAKTYFKPLSQLKQELRGQKEIAEKHPATAAFNLCIIVTDLISYMEQHYEDRRRNSTSPDS